MLHSDVDARILDAARGIRPELSDQDDLAPVLRFAPSVPTYKVMRDGSGTKVYLYGTDEHGHSVAVCAENKEPYMFVSLAPIDAYTDDAEARDVLVKTLVDELQQRLLLVCALQQRTKDDESGGFTPAEVVAFREAEQGYVQRETIGRGLKRLTLRHGRHHCAPIVRWSIGEGLPAKGAGTGAGYRGMATTRFLQLFFYCPSLVTKARALLHGRHAALGALRQARRLATVERRDDEADAAPVAGVGGGMSKIERAGRDEHQRRLTPDALDPPECDDDADSETDETDLEAALDQAEEAGTLYEDMDDDADIQDTSDESSDSEDEEPQYEVPAHEVEARLAHLEDVLAHRFLARMLRRAREPQRMLAPDRVYDVYEADIDFVLRFAIDGGFSYEQWLTIDLRATLSTRVDGSPAHLAVTRVTGNERETRAQIELRCDYRLLRFDGVDPLQNTAPPHVVVSLDGEMAPGEHGEFPKPESNAILMCVFIIRGRDRPDGAFDYRSVSFTLGECDTRADPRQHCTSRHVLAFADEAVLLRAIARFVGVLDPHVVTGYNTDAFDLPYMLARARHLGVGDAFTRAWGRSIYSSRMTARTRSFQSTQAGKIVFTDVRAEGVVFLDLLKRLQRDPLIKLRSYSLNAVAEEYIGEQKEDVAYTLINELARTPLGRERLRSYCEKDALLPLEIFERLQVMPGMIEMSRINVVPIEMNLNRGQQVRSKCCLYRIGATERPPVRFYTRTDAEREAALGSSFKGAVVVEPKPDLYTMPVVTLDQAALYPSTMVTHNLCFTTYVADDYDLTADPYVMRDPAPLANLSAEERERRAAAAVYTVCDMTQPLPYTEQPYERPTFADAPARAPRFLRHSIRLGIAPRVQLTLLDHRKRTKADMTAAYKAGAKARGDLLNQRQLAIKMLANSLYGTLSSNTSFAHAPIVGETVTRRGRCLIYLARAVAITEFAEHGIDVIYGDTDSIFVSLERVGSIEEAAKIGVAMAKRVTERMKQMYTTDTPQYNIFSLEFEKVFRALLLIAKKRYAGLKYEYSAKDGTLKPSPADGVPMMSGLESKRRDTTLLVSQYIPDVVALMLDYHYTARENRERARGYIWQHMVRPLLDGTINRRMLVVTKQLRRLPSEYAAGAAGVAVPIHVQLAQRLIERAGGADAKNAPRAGARLSYVVVVGAKHDKVSARGEDPEYALAHNLTIDARYYLDRHIKPPLVRLFVPVLTGRRTQRTLGGAPPPPVVLDAARKRQNEAQASEFLFGHRTEYYDPLAPGAHLDIVPATRRAEPLRRQRPRYAPMLISTEQRAGGQRTLGTSIRSGARCTVCQHFFAGEQPGYVCTRCAPRAADTTVATLRRYVLDIEDLRCERADLADTCHDCMGCRDAPLPITCNNADCPTLWDRLQNASSLAELERRLGTAYEMASLANAVERLSLDE